MKTATCAFPNGAIITNGQNCTDIGHFTIEHVLFVECVPVLNISGFLSACIRSTTVLKCSPATTTTGYIEIRDGQFMAVSMCRVEQCTHTNVGCRILNATECQYHMNSYLLNRGYYSGMTFTHAEVGQSFNNFSHVVGQYTGAALALIDSIGKTSALTYVNHTSSYGAIILNDDRLPDGELVCERVNLVSIHTDHSTFWSGGNPTIIRDCIFAKVDVMQCYVRMGSLVVVGCYIEAGSLEFETETSKASCTWTKSNIALNWIGTTFPATADESALPHRMNCAFSSTQLPRRILFVSFIFSILISQ